MSSNVGERVASVVRRTTVIWPLKRSATTSAAGRRKGGWEVCPSKSAPAGEAERVVVDQIKAIGRDPGPVAETIVEPGRAGFHGLVLADGVIGSRLQVASRRLPYHRSPGSASSAISASRCLNRTGAGLRAARVRMDSRVSVSWMRAKSWVSFANGISLACEERYGTPTEPPAGT